MIGIILNIDKLIDKVQLRLIEEISYLRTCLDVKESHIKELEEIIFKHVGLIRSEIAEAGNIKQGNVTHARTWKDRKALLESKFRPPELEKREKFWKDEIAKMEDAEVMENAG